MFDDAESSVNHAIKQYFDQQFIVYSIGINDCKFPKSDYYHYERIDLSLLNFHLINQLKSLPVPDIILASPPCESWSGADCSGKMFMSIDHDGHWLVKNRAFYDSYNQSCNPVKRRRFLQKETSRLLGEATVGATIYIIETFKPKVWVIENPQTSKTWMFQKCHWNFDDQTYKNLAYYSAYDQNFSPKPTIFKSNIKLNLRSKRVAGNKDHMARGSYSKRSSIPSELIKDILTEILHSDVFKS